jgi:hypothetical protein
MKSNTQDPFISKYNNLNSSNHYPSANTSINNIPLINKNVNELLNDEELCKKIGRMETILNYYEAKLKNEFNERKKLEDKIETLTMDVYHIRENFDDMSKLFTENFTKIKNNIMDNVETKNNSINKIVLESSKRLNTLEDIILNNNTNRNSNDMIYPQKSLQNIDNIRSNRSMNNSLMFSTQRDSSFMKQNYVSLQNNKYDILLNRINNLEKIVFKKGSYLGREEEINIGLTKVNHLEKKFEIFMENFNKDINIIKNNIKQNFDIIDNVKGANNILGEKFDNLYRTFNDTNINIDKFNYQTTLALNETQKKLEEYTDYFNNTKTDIIKMENDLKEEYTILKQILNEKLFDYEKNFNDIKNKINTENDEFKLKIEENQDIFMNKLQKENEDYLNEAKKIENNIMEKCELIQKDNKKLNDNINEIKNSFFHNLNEIEQYFNTKYQSLYKAINLQ